VQGEAISWNALLTLWVLRPIHHGDSVLRLERESAQSVWCAALRGNVRWARWTGRRWKL